MDRLAARTARSAPEPAKHAVAATASAPQAKHAVRTVPAAQTQAGAAAAIASNAPRKRNAAWTKTATTSAPRKNFLDDIYENMCKGTLGSSTTTDPNSAIVTLKRDTGRDLRRAKAANRRDAGCQGAGRLICPSINGVAYNCDEFPFASTDEGGSGASIKCVPSWQNDWQGTYYNSWLSEQMSLGKLARGGQYRIVLKNIDCSKYLRKRSDKRAESNGVLQQSGNTTLLAASLFGNHSTQNALLIDLTKDQDTPGTYTLECDISQGSIASGAIVDDDGEYLANLTVPSTGGKASASVDLEEDYGDIHFLGWTNDRDVRVSYQVKVTPATSSSASTTQATTASSTTQSTASTNSAAATTAVAASAGTLSFSLLDMDWSCTVLIAWMYYLA